MKRYIIILAILAFSIPAYIFGQSSGSGSKNKMTVSGIVLSPGNKPVAGAQIFVDRVNTGKTSDGLGKFKVKVNADAKVIIATSTENGFGQAEIIKGNTITVTLNGDTKNLDAFIEENTIIPSPKPEKPKKIITYNDIYQMIRHEVPGVVVSGKSIVIQQQNSFFGSSQPLFLVNGIRVNSIDNINPNEVKSIELLKGSYANIYGNEGANGVISITLKSGNDK